jgi:hypothetical protein
LNGTYAVTATKLDGTLITSVNSPTIEEEYMSVPNPVRSNTTFN